MSESLNGLSSLRAFKAEDRASIRLCKLLDRVNTPLFAQMTVKVWLSVRIQFFSAVVILFISLFGTLSTSFSPALLGFAISTASVLSNEISIFVMLSAALEAELVSVERLLEYCYNLPKEDDLYKTDDPKGDEWPAAGAITATNLSIKFESMERPVIKDVSLSISPGEMIGVVGRTGSGKSTLLSSLFRLFEPSCGMIQIDGRDISTLGLATLRNGLQIVPQDPVLFSGTIRSNLDPFQRCDDLVLWNALDLVGMKKFVLSLEHRLDFGVESGGANFSLGQRQCFVLAMAICGKPKFWYWTRHTTIISVAHRINTVANFDRVAVMDEGSLVEFDTPFNLLNKEGGRFKELVEATGAANAAQIRRLVETGKRAEKGTRSSLYQSW
ncbi:P-loop containing nucleoside triphosphate hydrolase protein [Chytridium lagenaria]|nr:P-loop containing nucleoside triphosphate hydrolase protein [Chytridium lagenaria]